jgi:CRP-like cAMP-binding protein
VTRSVCVLATLDSQRLRMIQPAIRQRSFRKGEVLLEEGERARVVYIVKVGTVFGQRSGLDGVGRPVGLWGRGAAFGLCGFFGQCSQLTGVAATAGRACGISMDALLAEAAVNPALADRIAATMVRCYGSMASWAEAMRLPGVVNQLAYTMLLLTEAQRSSVVELPNQKSLAALLGTTRESVARAMGLLEKSGSIRRLEPRVCEVARGRVLEQLGNAGGAPPLLAANDETAIQA